MNKPLSLILPDIEAVWCYERYRFDKLKQALDGMDYSLSLQKPAGAGKGQPGAMWDDDVDDDAPAKPYKVENEIALLYLSGPMTKQYNWLSYYYGGTSTQALRNLIRLAVADPDVTAILLIVYSPGGQVAGTQDLAADIAWAGTKKPFLSFIEDLGCSAAYWCASQAPDGVYINNTSCTVGSEGTIMGVDDTSKANEMAGVKTYVFASGDRKGIGTPGTELTEEQRAYLQSYIENVNKAFVASVQAARKFTPAQTADVTRAGVYVGQDAVKMGLVDGIASLDECKAKLQQKVAKRKNTISLNAQTELSPQAQHAPTAKEATLTQEEASASSLLLSTVAATATSAVPQAATIPAASSPANPNTHQSMPASVIVPRAGGEGKHMKEKLVRILSALGLTKMAVAIVSATDESPEALAQAMSEQVNAEVKERVQNHPLMIACEAAGIHTPEALGNVLDLRAIGIKHVEDLRADARSQAIRAYGPETGERIGATVNKLTAHEVKAMRDGWQAEADNKYGIGANGEAAQRVSVPKQGSAANAEESQVETPKSAWEQLTQVQRDHATRAGHAKTPEAREKFAQNFLGTATK